MGVTVAPDQNWHLYNYFRNETTVIGYHQTPQLGPQEQGSIDNVMDGVNSAQSFAETNDEAGVGGTGQFDSFGASYFGRAPDGALLSIGSGMVGWKCVDYTGDDAPDFYGQWVTAKYGTSAANPLILKGSAVSPLNLKC